ncbi:unnamed protein product [Protopolystoma xenopodis]|uniref:Uncharacterized protein n=1 Tax=Protopolystoma xenopodis TaxID=117903 RepID=A0A448WIY7_9PLAT|nr:unnamed protein product [Protopolystoma xenopodis]
MLNSDSDDLELILTDDEDDAPIEIDLTDNTIVSENSYTNSENLTEAMADVSVVTPTPTHSINSLPDPSIPSHQMQSDEIQKASCEVIRCNDTACSQHHQQKVETKTSVATSSWTGCCRVLGGSVSKPAQNLHSANADKRLTRMAPGREAALLRRRLLSDTNVLGSLGPKEETPSLLPNNCLNLNHFPPQEQIYFRNTEVPLGCTVFEKTLPSKTNSTIPTSLSNRHKCDCTDKIVSSAKSVQGAQETSQSAQSSTSFTLLTITSPEKCLDKADNMYDVALRLPHGKRAKLRLSRTTNIQVKISFSSCRLFYAQLFYVIRIFTWTSPSGPYSCSIIATVN